MPAPQPPGATPPFNNCPRCAYALSGLPARHTCPECGLSYDENCATFPVTNPRQTLIFWGMILLGGGGVLLRQLPELSGFTGDSVWDVIGLIAMILWLPMVVALAWVLFRRYRRGLGVTTTGDGLLIRLPGFREDVIPWARVVDVSVETSRKAGRPSVRVELREPQKRFTLGGVYALFPTQADATRFVEEVRTRRNSVAAGGTAD